MVVEKGEQCDCGYETDNSCLKDDPCCQGRNGTGEPQPGGCKLLPGKTCRLVSFFRSTIYTRCPMDFPKDMEKNFAKADTIIYSKDLNIPLF